ncbi:MAG: 1-deoxy-D-xylulose-5-phosphate reductoisomerase [Rhodocyclales bacterium]|nr:1-deoxy-D-xylulose-5-phosphate reductoisomerase [Rhodocyclales bacterium]
MNRLPLQQIVVLGATGSIGTSTLDVIARHPERFGLFALTAQVRHERMYEHCLRFAPRYAVLVDPAAADELRRRLGNAGSDTEVLCGAEALVEVASHPEVDTVMAAIVGAAGLLPTLAAVNAGKRILLANKEALVLAGGLFMQAARASGAQLLPIDSEHNAVFQSLPANYAGDPEASGVKRIMLTASGGPFRETPVDVLETVTPEQACAHPNWVMGRKISVDSASMMNKGLELIEAHWLFGVPAERIDVVVHPQSVIHSMVEYVDGSVLAQLGNPDMRTPIAHALGYPERLAAGVQSLDLFAIARLTFERPDFIRFPCLALAYAALREGGAAAAVLNAANEEAVGAFLSERLGFRRIADVIEATLERVGYLPVDTLDAVMDADRRARELARAEITTRQNR